MTGVFTTFYLKFKSNADDVIKGNKELEKSTKDTERSLKTTNDTTKEIGQNFVKMAEAAAGALGALGGLQILKSGVQNAIEYNTQLKLIGENAGITAEQLRTAGIAARLFGGTEQMGMSDTIAMAKARRQGLFTGENPSDWWLQLRKRMSTLPLAQQQNILDRVYGLSEAGIRQATSGGKNTVSDEEFAKKWQQAQKQSLGTNAAANAAYAANAAEVGLDVQTKDFFNDLLKDVSPTLQKILGWMQAAVATVSTGVGVGAIVAGKAIEGIGLVALAKKFWPVAKATAQSAGKVASGGLSAAESAEIFAGGVGVAGGVGLAAAAPYVAMAAGAGMIGYGGYKLYGSVSDLISKYSKKTPEPLASTFNRSNEIPSIGKDSTQPPNTEAMDAFQKQYEHITNAKHALSAASQLTPPSHGDITVTIEKIEINTQATDSKGIATGIAGSLKEEIYTALGFIASQSDNGQVR